MSIRTQILSAFICAIHALLIVPAQGAAQDREKLRAFLQTLPYKAHKEHVHVYSDISAATANELAQHGERAWQFFAKRFAQPPNKMDFIYVKSRSLYADIAKLAGWNVEPGDDNVGFLWDNDHGKLVLQTPMEPNYGAQLGELCRQALFCSVEGARDFPWLFEGLSLYYQSVEQLDTADTLVLRQPLTDYLQAFRTHERQGALVPLARLLTMRDKEFDAEGSLKHPAQALLLIDYLMREQPTVMEKLCKGLGKEYKSNNAVIDYLKAALKTDLAGLEKSYLAHARGIAAPAGSDLAKSDRLDALAKRFPFMAQDGPAVVFSDISKQHAQVHAKHLRFTWNYFAKLTGKTPGDKMELYYTRNEKLYEEIVRLTGSPQIPGAARRVAASHHGYWRMYILPYQDPDYETQLHEVSHLFIYHVFPGGLNAPWLMEGSGMYFECALKMDKNGTMQPKLLGASQKPFVELSAKGKLLPLKKFVTLSRDEFYSKHLGVSYNQSLVLFHFLMKTHPKVMTELFAQWQDGKLATNEEVLDYLTGALKMDLPTLEKRYVAHGLKAGR